MDPRRPATRYEWTDEFSATAAGKEMRARLWEGAQRVRPNAMKHYSYSAGNRFKFGSPAPLDSMTYGSLTRGKKP